MSEFVLAYVLWIVSCAVGLFVAWMVRNTYLLVTGVLTAGVATGDSHQQFQVGFTRAAVDRFGVVILAVVLVALVVFIEYYYRTGVEEGQLLRRFALLSAAEIAVLFLTQIVQIIASGLLGVFTISSVLLALLVLALTFLLYWLALRWPAEKSISK